MASSTQRDTFGLTGGETRLLLLSTVFVNDDGKVDFERIAKKAHVEPASAKTVYGKTKKKLLKNLGDDALPPTKRKPQPEADAEPNFEALVPADDSE
ncbi:Histone h1.3 [Penicillium frequentans]|nr:Histone h1.3 [Penicillium glabrum]